MEKNIGMDAFRTVIQFDELLFKWLKKLPIKAGQDIEIIVLPLKNKKYKSKKFNKKQLNNPSDEHASWNQLSQSNLNSAYSESEPEYYLQMVKEPNADYEGR
jgi:hypothetical protein